MAGFINALSDGVLSAYIPLLEALPACGMLKRNCAAQSGKSVSNAL
ncbi:MAG: hypothetical protein AB1453_03120 [Chloroflexota bacterium]